MAQDGDALGGVSVRGALEEDDPVTWDPHALGWAPEAESKGDRSSGRYAQWESEGPIRAMKRGNEMTPDPVEQRGARVGSNFWREP